MIFFKQALRDSSSHFGVDRVIGQINSTRRHNTRGFVIFSYGAVESKDLLPMSGLGITSKRQRPRVSAAPTRGAHWCSFVGKGSSALRNRRAKKPCSLILKRSF
jgi:hypothetical protein